jgi:hypothetical protein
MTMPDAEEVLDAINEKLGMPKCVVSTVSTLLGIPLLSTAVTALSAFSIVFFMWKYFKDRDLDSIKEEHLDREAADLLMSNDKLEKKLNYLYARRELLKTEVENQKGILRDKYVNELRTVENEIKVREAEYEENLDRIAFIKSLKLLVSHKKYLKEKGVWQKLDKLTKRANKAEVKFDASVLKHQRLREFLQSVDMESEFLRIS